MTVIDLLCSGPGPHDPADGVLGQAEQSLSGLLCPPCAALALATAIAHPPASAPDLPAIADQVTQLTDAVNLLILNSLGV